jgi:1-acyl-sn-glycerol-3-phosphate acyltransferase
MTFVESVIAILEGKPVRARLACLPALEGEGAHRRELAQAAHDAIGASLGIVRESVDAEAPAQTESAPLPAGA